MGSSSSKPIPEPSIHFLTLGGKYKVKNKIVTVTSVYNNKGFLVRDNKGLVKKPESYYLPADTTVYTSSGSNYKLYKLYELSYVSNEEDYMNGFELTNPFSNLVTIEQAIDPTILSQINWKKNNDQLLDDYLKKTRIRDITIYNIEHNTIKANYLSNDKYFDRYIVYHDHLTLNDFYSKSKYEVSVYTFFKRYDYFIDKKDVKYLQVEPTPSSMKPVSTPGEPIIPPQSIPNIVNGGKTKSKQKYKQKSKKSKK
jgi:hypothetical protein